MNTSNQYKSSFQRFHVISKLIFIGFLTNILTTCASAERTDVKVSKTPNAQFYYDESTGKCMQLNSKIEGFNIPNPKVLFANLNTDKSSYGPTNAECINFSGFNFDELKTPSVTSFVKWNFKGSTFAGSSLHFAKISDANLRGADLRNFNSGYLEIHGQGDQYTHGGNCAVAADFSIHCKQ
jgi:uncharacterized protein YjbI with pentapeptide repeats